MRYDQLRELIQPHLKVPVEDVYADFRTATGKDDADNFLAYLQDRELISNDVFREIHGRAGGVDLGPVVAPSAATRGVMGATMVQPENDPRPLLEATVAPRVEERPNYAMMGLLGEGSMGKIYLAKDLSLRRKVAFKELKRELAAASPDIRERFINEAQITAQMDHPNVVPVYSIEVKDEAGVVAYAMKLVQGKTLKELINECKQFHDLGKELDDDHTLSTRLEYFLRICDAMAYAHSKGVIHRDLKPANIMIGRYNEVYVMDWGIARMVQSIMQPEATTMIELARKDGHMPVIEPTQAGQAVGTPRYMSPEQAAGANMDLDERSDLYTLGTILFEMVVLKPAITGNSLKEAMVNVMKGNIEPYEHYSPKERIPRELKAIIDKAIILDREKRYRSVKEFADDIRRFLRGDPISILPEGTMARLQRWITQHRQATLLLVMSLLLLSASVLIWSLRREQMSSSRQAEQTRDFGRATGQAAAVDAELLRIQSLTEGIRSAATVALETNPPEDARHFDAKAFRAAEPDKHLAIEPAPRYGGKPTSVAYGITTVRSGVDPKSVAREIKQLATLRMQLARLMLRSLDAQSQSAALRSRISDGDQLGFLIREEGVPVARVYVALTNGVHMSYPGVASLPAGFDARKSAWYKKAITTPGVHWSLPRIDGQGQGIILTCSTALVRADGLVIGVVGLDLPIRHLVHGALKPDASARVLRTMILDSQGKVLVDSNNDGSDKIGPGGSGDSPLPLTEVELPAAARLARARITDHATEGDNVIVSCPLKSLPGATFVAVLSKPSR